MKSNMNFKIINTPDGYPDVLVRRDTEDECADVIVISAWGTVNGENDLIVEEIIRFEGPDTLQDFIEAFTVQMAVRFCDQKEITY